MSNHKLRYGLSQLDRTEMNNIFQKYSGLQKVILFGSRAKGNFRKGSDIDIALELNPSSRKIVNAVHDELEEETKIPYFFDVIDLKKISSPELCEHIRVCGKEIYKG